MWHDWITRQLLQRVWNWRIAMAIKQREIKPAPLDNNGRSQWSQVRWSIGEMGWVDPNKEITAYRDAWNVCKESLDDLARKEGSTRDLKIKKKQEDIRAAIRAALDIEQEFKERNIRVSWDQIINAGVPGVMTSGQTLSVQAGKDEDDADSD
jgi:capsid protein